MSEDKDAAPRAGDRIRFHDDEEDQRRSRRRSQLPQGRSRSTDSISIRRVDSRRRSIGADPAVALPITYRTV
jgi:hypothetical protein